MAESMILKYVRVPIHWIKLGLMDGSSLRSTFSPMINTLRGNINIETLFKYIDFFMLFCI